MPRTVPPPLWGSPDPSHPAACDRSRPDRAVPHRTPTPLAALTRPGRVMRCPLPPICCAAPRRAALRGVLRRGPFRLVTAQTPTLVRGGRGHLVPVPRRTGDAR